MTNTVQAERPLALDANWFRRVVDLIHEAEMEGPLATLDGVDGLSGTAIIGTLQRLARHSAESGMGDYLEVGVFRGNTLLSVAHALRNAQAIGIDDFSQFDPDGSNRNIVHRGISAHDLTNVILLNMDYEDALDGAAELQGRRIALYFVDGPHDYRSQLMCLLLAQPHLAKGAIIVVDDSNYRHVRQANRDFLHTHPDFALLFEAYTPAHPSQMTPNQLEQARAGWWDGINIIVHDPERVLPRRYPTTHRDRSLYLAEHVIHANRYALEAASGLRLVSTLRDRGLPYAMLQLLRLWRRPFVAERAPFRSANTYSEGLPSSQCHLPGQE